MQLRDKLDFSFRKSKRSLILKTVVEIIKPIAVTAIFFLVFYLMVAFSVFPFSAVLPDTVVNLVFTLMQIMSIVTCTAGLSQALFTSADNKVLLTLPVSSTEIFVSKLILFYVFELKRNLYFSLPMFLAYGIVNGAVWYYYFWLILCFLFISFVPVALGAVLSIPAMYVASFVRRFRALQYVLIAVAAGLVVWGIVFAINQLPENINLLGQWGTISRDIEKFLNAFANALVPFYWLCLLVVGGSLRISTSLFGLDTLAYLGGTIGVIVVFFGLAFLLAKPLFFKMASKQFEYEKMIVPPRKNKVRNLRVSPYLESWQMQLRDSKNLALIFVELALPAIAILFLNKLYAAMNTSFTGQKLTQTFNIVVMFVILLSFNTPYASVYSKEANARNILKTRPANPVRVLFARISLRGMVSVLSCIAMIVTYQTISGEKSVNVFFLFVAALAATLAHLLWAAEIDVMHSQADQFQTVGTDYDNPNERNTIIIGMLLAALFALAFHLLSDRGVTKSFLKIALLALAILGARIYLYVTRIKLYFAEN